MTSSSTTTTNTIMLIVKTTNPNNPDDQATRWLQRMEVTKRDRSKYSRSFYKVPLRLNPSKAEGIGVEVWHLRQEHHI